MDCRNAAHYDDSEEKKRLLVELSKVIPDYDRFIPEYKVFDSKAVFSV